ncbi:hypothetical protein AB0L82_36305 [Nocardia sp. NPDC052001]|uniref:hypothetical protein n=1 Tax=Nocardia sp. NPDC052001 TaxID=3154853 RepID=UPI00344360E1
MSGSQSLPPALRPRCSICGANLTAWANRNLMPGVEVRTAPVDDRMEYQLRLLGVSAQTRCSRQYTDVHGVNVFHVCGAGHIYFVRNEYVGISARMPVAESKVDLVAILGSVAAGKSYLTVRTLNQSLARPYGSGWLSVAANPGKVVESRPLSMLESEYDLMRGTGQPMQATQLDSMLPIQFLRDIHPGLVADMTTLIGEATHRPGLQNAAWLSTIRQPVVRRYAIGETEMMLAVADLSGETFDSASRLRDGAAESQHTLMLHKLAEFDTLVWAVDPAVSTEFISWGASGDETLVASTRPEGLRRDLRQVQTNREGNQSYVADLLADSNELNRDSAWRQRLVVVITKSDLLDEALASGRQLSELGEEGAVLEAMVSNLRYLLDKAAANDPRWQFSRDPQTAQLFRRLSLRNRTSREAALGQFATALLEHFSKRDAFWALVHTGTPMVIDVPEAEPAVDHPPYVVRLGSIKDYLELSLMEADRGALNMHDIVMSTLACGIAGGLGFGGEVATMLNQSQRTVMFSLCSPFGGVPKMRPAQEDSIELRGSSRVFPLRKDRSAGLVQLHLHLLRRCLA